ncbi:MAG TPA: carbamoyl phosphate synthase small subunit [Candidatus Avidehalobacter gallistercoris]|uniref:Carbamoyl phosphate synthase small chain n=1 Tax=Candidatus Avidehalobacter gallistercoris TaxID=2840694 RepID=A0A9D1HKU2_9FIRM|nr:carbamoyl phosphate synthase small subunit [Candidatus Avidehalobacter gallistercoris]
MVQKLYLILENGRVFAGEAFGWPGEVTGELVFTTAMVGYLETLTDPSFYGQIVVQTFPLIGNYGVIPADFESAKPHLKAYIVREWCREPSNFRSEGSLDTFLMENHITGLAGIDTRALTRIIREHGVMNARITANPEVTPEVLAEIKAYRITDSVNSVSRADVAPAGEGRKVVLWDFGAKGSIAGCLEQRGCRVVNMPASAKAADILAERPDGIMLSNGPGDPSDNMNIVAELKEVLKGGVPMFGICLGHQLLALAHGAKTDKLHYGHRGANQPVKDVETGQVYITSQNHGYAVLNDTLPADAKVRFVNANDGTCEGVDYLDKPVFSVQFHPEAAAGPLDTSFLFDRFVALIDAHKEEK